MCDQESTAKFGPDTMDGHQKNGEHQAETTTKRLKQEHPVSNAVSKEEKVQAISDVYEYKSSVFRMEIEELLSEVCLNYKRMGSAEKVLHKLKNIIDSIPERLNISIAEAEKEMRKHKIDIPFPEPKPTKDVNYKFSYSKPSNLNVVGCYALKTAIEESEGIAIDVALVMPSLIFQAKDYLNYRYFHKRAYFLASLAAGIQGSKDLSVKLSFDQINDDPLRPLLVVSSSGDGGEFDFSSSKCTIRLIPCISSEVFDKSKLLPSKNCVRPLHAVSDETSSVNKQVFDPTPSYNSSILADTTYFPYLALLHASSSSSPAFKDACILGRIWLRQRGFGGAISKGGFGNFEWSILMAFLLKKGEVGGHSVLAGGYSKYQMFKATLQLLATKNLSTTPLLFGVSGDFKFPRSDTPVFYDGEHGLNLFFKMTPWSYNILKYEAVLTLKTLNDSAVDHFDAVFLQRADEPCYRFDTLARIPIPKDSELLSLTEKQLDCPNKALYYALKLHKTLLQGLGDRVALIHLSLPSFGARKITGHKGTKEAKYIVAGFLLDAAHCGRAVDHGPPAERKKEAAEYRKFWGSKSELRRFKDGSILESLVWNDKASKLPVLQQIITYVVDRHLGPHVAKGITFIGDELARILPKNGIAGSPATAPFHPAMSGFDMLVKDLRALEGLPLHIRQVSAAASALRYSTPYIPLSADSGNDFMEPADVVLQFESSTKWPDDLVAIQKTKLAFLLRIAELLEKSKGNDIHTRIGLENEGREIMNATFLDIIYMTGASFRIRIYHDREVELLQRRLKDKTIPPRSREEAALAFSEHRRLFVQAPLHTQDIQKLCHRFPCLSPSIRLIKKWFSEHLLFSHVTNELLELITAYCFLNPSPWAAPSSVMTGFLRTLQFLSQWDWRTDPLIVDLSGGDLTSGDIEGIKGEFDACRKNDPALHRLVIFAASNHDRDGTTWTENSPSKVVAARITSLARSACMVVKKNDLSINFLDLFIPSLEEYDFIIHLNPHYTAHELRKKKQSSKFKNLQQQPPTRTHQDIAKLGLDPIHLLLNDLSNIYGSNIIFFRNTLVDKVIGCIWSPYTAGPPRAWKVNLPYSTTPVIVKNEGEEKSIVNKPAIMNEISRLGGELITRIEVNR